MIAARKPTGTRASRRRAVDAASAGPRRRRRRGRCSASRSPRRSRPAAARRCRCRCSPCTPGPGVRRCTCGSTNAGNACLPDGVDRLGAGAAPAASPGRRARRSSRRGSGCRAARRARCAGSSTCAPRISSSAGLPRLVEETLARTSSRRPPVSRVGSLAAARSAPASRQQLVEDRHPDGNAGLDLLADQRLRASRSRRPTARRRG